MTDLRELGIEAAMDLSYGGRQLTQPHAAALVDYVFADVLPEYQRLVAEVERLNAALADGFNQDWLDNAANTATERDFWAKSLRKALAERDTFATKLHRARALADEAITIICQVGFLGLDPSRREELHAKGIRLRKDLAAVPDGTEEQR